jgi:hypothetical protein
MRAGLNPMLRFRTTPDELRRLDLSHPTAAGSNLIYCHEGTIVTGATKVFRTGDRNFRYEGSAMTYYYFHGTPENKARDRAENVVSLWGDYRFCEANLMRNEHQFTTFRQKYPAFTAAMTNSFLARSGKSREIEAPFFMMRLNDLVPDYGLYVPFDASASVRSDMKKCNFEDVNRANQSTQLLLRVSMAIDQEIFRDEAEFTIDMIKLGDLSG